MMNQNGITKNLVMPVSVIVLTVIGIAANACAYHYRFVNPYAAKSWDIVGNGAIAVIFIMLAKINLTRVPQHQNLALFAASVAGLMVGAMIDNIHFLFLK